MRNRQTGRTTRMLLHAKELAESGKAVYVVAANSLHAKQLDEMAKKLGVPQSVKIERNGEAMPLDWRTLRTHGMHDNCEVLVDHFAIESEFDRLLEMLHRYDQAD